VPDSDARPRRARRWAAIGGVALGAAVVAVLLLRPRGFVEREEFRELAPPAELAAWQAEWDRRAAPHARVPDPPGEGEVVVERWWISRGSYPLEVRRRGRRVVVETHGIDEQVMGGGWTAFGEGTVSGDGPGLAGAVARISWSCLGIRYRAATDGVARLEFSRDGEHVTAVYSAYETWLGAEPFVLMKAYGVRARGARPPHATLRGQIPYRDAMPRHAADAVVRVTGTVRTPEGAPVADALVTLKGAPESATHADEEGRFELSFSGRRAPWAQSVAAGALGHRNGEAVLFTGDPTDGVAIELVPLDLRDHRDYGWVHPAPDRDPDDAMACGTCHSWQYTEWVGSRHARMADHGHVAWERERMRLRAPSAPDDCGACHQPGEAATSGRVEYAPRGVLASNHCDLCHKARFGQVGVAPGVLGNLVLARPDPADASRPGSIHRVFGPAADVTYAYMGASYDPALSTSWLCAACHEGGGLPGRGKIATFDEWRAWAPTAGERFRECQGCHMPAGTTVTVEGKRIDLYAWETLHRGPETVHSHAFPGASPSLARDALEVGVAKRWDAEGGRWSVDVSVTNRGAGHKIPTGTWTKHVAVGVWARQGGRWLEPEDGERVAFEGEAVREGGDAPAGGDWRSPPGFVLGVFEKGTSRLATFWDPPPADAVDDRRLAPGATRTVRARFRPAAGGPGEEPKVEVRIVHRRGAFGAGSETVPWTLRPYDPPPQVEWLEVTR
jgi:hypothetical protein